jgi:hypothetical protein
MTHPLMKDGGDARRPKTLLELLMEYRTVRYWLESQKVALREGAQ